METHISNKYEQSAMTNKNNKPIYFQYCIDWFFTIAQTPWKFYEGHILHVFIIIQMELSKYETCSAVMEDIKTCSDP